MAAHELEITKVKYHKLVTLQDRYDNVSFGAEADVEDGETPEDARTNLVYWVNEYLTMLGHHQDDVYDLQDRLDTLKNAKEGLEADIKKLSDVKHKALEFLEKNGCNVSIFRQNWDSELPF